MADPVDDEYTRRLKLWLLSKKGHTGELIPPSLSAGLGNQEDEDPDTLLKRLIGDPIRREPEETRSLLRPRPGNGKVREPILSDDVARVLAQQDAKRNEERRPNRAADVAEMLPGQSDDDLAATVDEPTREYTLRPEPAVEVPTREYTLRTEPAVEVPTREGRLRSNPPPRDEPTVTAERRLTPKDVRRYAVEPRLLGDNNADLAARLAGMTMDNSDLTDGLPLDKYIKRQKAAKAEAQLQREMNLDQKQQDQKFAYQRQSGQTQRYGTDIRGRGIPDPRDPVARDAYLSNMAPQKRLGNTEAEIRRNMQLTQRRPPDAARGAGGNDTLSDGEWTPQQIEARNARMKARYFNARDANARLSPGTGRTIDANGRIALQGVPEDPDYLAKISRQAGLSDSVESLEEFQQQQALNRKQNSRIADETSTRNLAALIRGRSGGDLPADADLKTTRAFNQGRRNGPTTADIMQYQKDETAKKRSEAEREQKQRLLAQLVAANRDAPTPALKAQIAALSADLTATPSSSNALPSVSERQSPDELWAQTTIGRQRDEASAAREKQRHAAPRLSGRGLLERLVGLPENEEGLDAGDVAGAAVETLLPGALPARAAQALLKAVTSEDNPDEQPSALKTGVNALNVGGIPLGFAKSLFDRLRNLDPRMSWDSRYLNPKKPPENEDRLDAGDVAGTGIERMLRGL